VSDRRSRKGSRLNPSTLRSRHFIWQAMQRPCIDGYKLCETARRRCPNGVRKNLRAEVEKTSFAAIALPTIGTIGVDADTVTDLPPRYALAHVQDATRKFMAHDHAGSIDTVCSRMESDIADPGAEVAISGNSYQMQYCNARLSRCRFAAALDTKINSASASSLLTMPTSTARKAGRRAPTGNFYCTGR
jgi:hypothetical protein